MSERAQALEAALREIVEDLEARWDMSDPRTNPGIRDNVERARRLLAVRPQPDEQLCDGCLCSGEACAAYRKAGKICCPDCDHMRRPQPEEKGHLPTCSSWRCAWEWSTTDGAGVCRLPRGSEIHYVGTVDSHAFMASPCDCVPAPVSPVAPEPPTEAPIDKRTTGLHWKFVVSRTDGSSAPGGKHEGCDYFVLDLTHDPHAVPALRAYADSCRADYPLLAADLAVEEPTGAPAPCVWREAPRDRVLPGCKPERWFDRVWASDFANCPYCGRKLECQQ